MDSLLHIRILVKNFRQKGHAVEKTRAESPRPLNFVVRHKIKNPSIAYRFPSNLREIRNPNPARFPVMEFVAAPGGALSHGARNSGCGKGRGNFSWSGSGPIFRFGFRRIRLPGHGLLRKQVRTARPVSSGLATGRRPHSKSLNVQGRREAPLALFCYAEDLILPGADAMNKGGRDG